MWVFILTVFHGVDKMLTMASTIRHVAQKAGVSPATVSRVMRADPSVTAHTSAKVMSVAQQLGFTPRPYRQKQNSNGIRTGSVGLLLVKQPLELLHLPLYVTLLGALEAALAEKDLHLVMMQLADTGALPRTCSRNRLDGVFVLGCAPAGIRKSLRELNPVLLLSSGRVGDKLWADWVCPDFEARGHVAANYLLRQGHRRIAFFNPVASHWVFTEVRRGFEDAARSVGVEPVVLCAGEDIAIPWDSRLIRRHVEELVDQLLALPADQRPTGMHTVNDEITAITHQVLAERGVRPGQDVEMVSCGNEQEHLRYLQPRPASMDGNLQEIARQAVEKMLYRIKNPESPVGARLLVPPMPL